MLVNSGQFADPKGLSPMLEIVVREGQLTLVRAVQPSNLNVSTTVTRLGSERVVRAVQF